MYPAAPQVAQVASMYKCIVEVKVKLGQRVKKGDLLFTSNTARFEAQKTQAKNLERYYGEIFQRRKKTF